MELTLTRTYYPWGTNGTIKNAKTKQWICNTIELPWKDNQKLVSCIPEGRYELKTRYSRRFRNHFIVQGVKGRSLILIHPANDAARELRGCIAPVTLHTGPGKGRNSKQALEFLKGEIMDAISTGPVYLTIKS